MLLPSAMSCDGDILQPNPRRPQRPKLYSFEKYMPPRTRSPVLGLIASCRALQCIIGDVLSPIHSPSLETTMQITPTQNPFGTVAPKPSHTPAPRSESKRSRQDFEDEQDQVILATPGRESCMTPKRRRIMPLEIPPGLQVSDFESLVDNNYNSQMRTSRPTPRQIDMPCDKEIKMAPVLDVDMTWTDADDRFLVETVLSKLSLSSFEWNDCAKRLGKDKDTLGQRWRMLLSEGDVGLRRGSRRLGRPDLDIQSW